MGSKPFWLSIHVYCFHYKYSAIKIQEISHAIKNTPSLKIWTHCALTSYPTATLRLERVIPQSRQIFKFSSSKFPNTYQIQGKVM